jgi:O-antigen/teichoic acid export membrane protein
MKVNQLKAGALLSYVSMGIGYLIMLIYTPIMLRILGQSEYGLYTLVESVVSYLGILNFGFGSAYIRYFFKYKVNEDMEKIAKLNGMFLILFSSIGVLSLLLGLGIWFNANMIFGSKLTVSEYLIVKKLLAIMVINVAISFPEIVFNSYVIAHEKFIFQRLLRMLKVILNPFLVILILYLGFGSIGMAVVITIINIIAAIINVLFCFNKLEMKFRFRSLDLRLMKEITVFSSYIFYILLWIKHFGMWINL